MSSDLTLPPRDAIVLHDAKSFVEEAATGAQRALAMAERSLEDAYLFQRLGREMMRTGRAGDVHPELTENSKEGAARRTAVRQYHEMSLSAAKLCIDLGQKALWFQQVIRDNGGPAGAAAQAERDEEERAADGPLARLAEIHKAGEAAYPSLPPRARKNDDKRRDAVLAGAREILEQGKK